MSSIESLEDKIRGRLNEFGQSKFGKQKWFKICAALNNIGDTALALKSYRKGGLGKTFPTQYLRLFGVLQSIVIQQDSIKFLWKDTIGSWNDPSSDSGWVKIRRLRVIISGHPAKESGAVARITIENQQLLVTHFDKSKNQIVYETHDLKSLVKGYTHEAEKSLNSLYQELPRDTTGMSSKRASTS